MLDRAPDGLILERAEQEERVVVTADLDYPRLLALAEVEKPGLILFCGGNWNDQDAFDRLAKVLDAIPEKELAHSIVVIERRRIRRRKLPVQ